MTSTYIYWGYDIYLYADFLNIGDSSHGSDVVCTLDGKGVGVILWHPFPLGILFQW